MGRREEGGVVCVDGSVNQLRCDPRTVAPRCANDNNVPACSFPHHGGHGPNNMETEAPVSDHVKFEDSPASPSDLDDVSSVLGDEEEAASLLSQLSEGGLDTQSVSGCSWTEALADISPSLNVHVGHMTVYVQEDRISAVRTATHTAEALVRDS